MPTAFDLLCPGQPFCLMGVVNVTPDSFYSGSRFPDANRAVDHCLSLATQGARIIDLGGESSRPGSGPVDAAEEADRVLPVITRLKREMPAVHISIDTAKPAVARQALEAGADLINDITAGQDPAMVELAVRKNAFFCLMHMRDEPRTMQQGPEYRDAVTEIRDFLLARAARVEQAGLGRERIILDPGIGFGKTLEHNLSIIKSLGEFANLPYAILLGASRKSFIHALSPSLPEQRLAGSLAAAAAAWRQGIRFFRVHDVYETRQFLQVLSNL
jgi:dihydropteroate synthase